MPESDHEALATAYEERTRQLYDMRAALSSAVSALAAELNHMRRQLDLAVDDSRAMRERERVLETALREQQHAFHEQERSLVERIYALERELTPFRSLGLVRLARWMRRGAGRMRQGGR